MRVLRGRSWARRRVRGAAVAATAAMCLSVALWYASTPAVLPRTEIYRGVFLTVEEPRSSVDAPGVTMVAEIHWDVPGVRIRNRPFSYPVSESDQSGPHYRLVNADWALLSTGASLLVNTTLYDPSSPWRAWPGVPVRSLETVVANGTWSHVDPHSYLLYWDRALKAHMVETQPTCRECLSDGVEGFGVQGVQVSQGKPRYQAISNLGESYPRTFIGVDPDRRILYLMAFENATARFMVDKAIEKGVVFGGQVDSGSSSTLLVGRGARDVRPHTGLRHWRPLGAHLSIFAEPLE